MIPKTIHYCWFGRNPKPKLFKKCYRSWKKYCPDFEIIEWNEDNFEIEKAPLYVQQAYSVKKWAFVSDYVRLWAVYNYGGVYLDTDVELIHSIDELLIYNAYFGFDVGKRIATGLGFGAVKNCYILLELMNDYNTLSFILNNGEMNLLPCSDINTHVFSDHQFLLNGEDQIIDNIALFSWERFNPHQINGVIIQTQSKKTTYSIHNDAASWFTDSMRKEHNQQVADARNHRRKEKIERIIHTPNRIARRLLGDVRYELLKEVLKKGI